jgi:hypothetical protein
MRILSLCLIAITLIIMGCRGQAIPDEPVQSEPAKAGEGVVANSGVVEPDEQGQTEPGQAGSAPDAPPDAVGQAIDSFEACVQAGYPVMESYPRQCRTPDGQTFVEAVVVTADRPLWKRLWSRLRPAAVWLSRKIPPRLAWPLTRMNPSQLFPVGLCPSRKLLSTARP